MTPATVENFRLNAALSYAARGWHVFPIHWPKIGFAEDAKCSCPNKDCTQIGKHPLTENGLWDALIDESKIRKWWEKWPAANIGIATGAVSGFVVLDVDLKSNGEDSLQLLQDEIGELPATWEVRTGGGGTHYLFSHPGEKVWCGAGMKGWLKKPGLDMRGDGGYIVAAPSQHKTGNRYRWEDGREPDDLPIAPMPASLLGLMRTRQLQPRPQSSANVPKSDGDSAFWVSRALQKASEGSRNDTGYWLACQLRDAGISENESIGAMRDYANRCPQGSEPYAEREAEATRRGVYRQPKREPARGMKVTDRVLKIAAEAKPKIATKAAVDDLRQFYSDVSAGKIYNVPFAWPVITRLAEALLPGTITCVCGDPGTGKTFFVLQNLQSWVCGGYDVAAFFVEKDKVFYTRRLLAQLEKDWRFKEIDWAKSPESQPVLNAALARNNSIIEDIAKSIHCGPEGRVTLDTILEWITKQAASGKRVIVVDPISAAAAGEKRWLADDDFIHAAQRIVGVYGASLVLVTHSRKGNRPGASSGHDMGGGAAYYRFSDAAIWIQKPKKPRKVRYLRKVGNGSQQASGRFSIFFQLHKTREGSGNGAELAFTLEDGGLYVEQGIVIAEVQEGDEESSFIPAQIA